MKTPVNPSIAAFANDFGLLNDGTDISFNSRILFLENAVPNTYICKTAIVAVPSKAGDAVYFLDACIKEDGFEDYFLLSPDKIEYLQYEGLLLHASPTTKIYIFPLDTQLQKKIPGASHIAQQSGITAISPLLIRGQEMKKERQYRLGMRSNDIL